MVKRAAKNKNFYVEYQPIVELESRRVIGAEALVRWKSKVAIVRPDHFIPLAEERGLIHLITEQVINIVTRDLPRFLEFNPDFEVAINMSAADLRSGHTHQLLDQMLVSSGVRAHNVEIEATERAFLQGPETARLIGTLRENGFSVAIDDFGTGYSSLACLQSLSLDTLKIDKAFVETIGTDGATSQVVQHIIEMARSLKLHIVAEGVETEVQAIFLEKRGVQYAQGWLFGKPVPINTFCKNLENQPVAAQNTLP
jgi:sensor c-di-GMP phosphodiesterase-like protein